MLSHLLVVLYADGNYTGGLGNHMTTDPTKAMKDDDGTPVDIYEAYIENKTVTDKYKDTYAVSYTDVEILSHLIS